MSKANRMTRRHRSVGPIDLKPGWELMRDFYLRRFDTQLKEKK